VYDGTTSGGFSKLLATFSVPNATSDLYRSQ